jgi:hypothetical protein
VANSRGDFDNSENSLKPLTRLQRPFAKNQQPALLSHSRQSLDRPDLNSDGCSEESSSSSWRDSPSEEPTKHRRDGGK